MMTIYRPTLLCALSLNVCSSCGKSDTVNVPPAPPGDSDVTDITNLDFSNRSGNCEDYAGEYKSSATDIARAKTFTGRLTVTVSDGKCKFASNSVPNHDFNDGNIEFANTMTELELSVEIPKEPKQAATPTELSLLVDNAVFLNGVKLDQRAAACYGVGSAPLGQEKIGCPQSDRPWRYDPMSEQNNFARDSHNAHTQADGGYHYHGSPAAMFPDDNTAASPVIGFAADGFPIRGPYVDDGGAIRKVRSSYQLRDGDRESQAGEGAFPGGSYDGRFIDDYAFVEDAGDLDECNGRIEDGVYSYFVTDSFPWVIGCFKGAPDPSFNK